MLIKDCIDEFYKCCKKDWAVPSVDQLVFWLRKQGYDLIIKSKDYEDLIIRTKKEYHNDLGDAYDSGVKQANILTEIKLSKLLSEYTEYTE